MATVQYLDSQEEHVLANKLIDAHETDPNLRRYTHHELRAGIEFTCPIVQPGKLELWQSTEDRDTKVVAGAFGFVAFKLFHVDWGAGDPAPLLQIRRHLTVELQVSSFNSGHATNHKKVSPDELHANNRKSLVPHTVRVAKS